jgi:ABC-type sugar transport system ATPase subunit
MPMGSKVDPSSWTPHSTFGKLKSRTLELIGRLLNLTSGNIFISGNDVTSAYDVVFGDYITSGDVNFSDNFR